MNILERWFGPIKKGGVNDPPISPRPAKEPMGHTPVTTPNCIVKRWEVTDEIASHFAKAYATQLEADQECQRLNDLDDAYKPFVVVELTGVAPKTPNMGKRP